MVIQAHHITPRPINWLDERFEMANTVAVHINIFDKDDGILIVPFSQYDEANRTCTEIGRFLIPWHELHDVIERLERIEKMKIDRDCGNGPF